MDVNPRTSSSSKASLSSAMSPRFQKRERSHGRILMQASASANSDYLIRKHEDDYQSDYLIQPHIDVLPWPYFLRQLEREQRRADRTSSPLSLVIFRPSAGADSGAEWGVRMLEVLGNMIRGTDLLSQSGPEQVVVLLPETDERGARKLIEKIASKTESAGLSATCATYPDKLFNCILSDRAETDETVHLFAPGLPTTGDYIGKRVLDVLGSGVALAVLLPLMCIVAGAIKLNSPGPVIFRQTRLGRRGVPFVLYKFRSMRSDTDDCAHREFVTKLIKGEHDGVGLQTDGVAKFKISSDARVTKVGAFIRKTSIDELPQFFNVLLGDMSLVGPRPPIKYEAENYQSWHLRRILEAKPGVTGIWQVYGRSKVAFDDMVRMDLNYIKNSSLRLDLKLIFATIGAVLRRDGAM